MTKRKINIGNFWIEERKIENYFLAGFSFFYCEFSDGFCKLGSWIKSFLSQSYTYKQCSLYVPNIRIETRNLLKQSTISIKMWLFKYSQISLYTLKRVPIWPSMYWLHDFTGSRQFIQQTGSTETMPKSKFATHRLLYYFAT